MGPEFRQINRFEDYLSELRQHRAWKKVPIDQPYGSEERMLVAELGKHSDQRDAEIKLAKHGTNQHTAGDRNPISSRGKSHTDTLKRLKRDAPVLFQIAWACLGRIQQH